MGIIEPERIDANEAGWLTVRGTAEVHDVGIGGIDRETEVIVALGEAAAAADVVIGLKGIIGWDCVHSP